MSSEVAHGRVTWCCAGPSRAEWHDWGFRRAGWHDWGFRRAEWHEVSAAAGDFFGRGKVCVRWFGGATWRDGGGGAELGEAWVAGKCACGGSVVQLGATERRAAAADSLDR